jgi:hypothetical protein
LLGELHADQVVGGALKDDFGARGGAALHPPPDPERPQCMSPPPAPASENIFAILRHLALVQPIAPNSRPELLNQLAADPNSFKIIVTSQPRGSIPSELWNTSYIVFASDLSA